MTGTQGFTEFFVLEASEYIEQIDGLLLAGSSDGPNAEELQRLARALRGSATMAKLTSFAGLAAAVERVGRALREGEAHWSPALYGSLVASVDDLKTLVRSARSWSPDDDRRAGSRIAELTAYAPPRTSGAFRAIGERAATDSSSSTSSSSSSYLGNEAANIAAGLELLTTRPADSGTAGNVMGRIRALRGVAEVKEAGPLADVLEATEDAARGLDSGAAMSPESRRVLQAATSYLRALTATLRASGSMNAPGSARDEFTAAVAEWRGRTSEAERVVPISALFFEDGAPGVVEAASHPPTSAQDRFRLETVSLSEHLHAVVERGRRAVDPEAVERARRDAVRAIRALEASAESFGERAIAIRAADHLQPAEHLNGDDLEALTEFADSLAGRPTGASASTPRTPAVVPQASEPEPAMTPPEVREADAASLSLLDSSIAALDQLTSAPMISPTPIPEDVIVPIETLLYRGRAALDRAVEVRDEMRRAPEMNPATLEELFDLVELARAE